MKIFKKNMAEQAKGIDTKYGILQGRDCIYLDSIQYVNESTIDFNGELNTGNSFVPYSITFAGIIWFQQVELDFDERNFQDSFAMIHNSNRLALFSKLDHSKKISSKHCHFYLRTYDSVFEIIADGYQLFISPDGDTVDG